MILYHGSKYNFDRFSYEYIGGTSLDEGYGFYFTPDIDLAKRYSDGGFIYECKIDVNKSLSEKDKTITLFDLKKLVEAIQEEDDILSLYGDIEYEGYKKVLAYLLRTEFDSSYNDVDLIASLSNGIGNMELVLKKTKEVLGYDHILSIDNKFKNTNEFKDTRVFIILDNDDISISRKIKVK